MKAVHDDVEALRPEPAAAPTLLLVDDEPSILNALRRLFRPLGYRVLATGSSACAGA